MLDVGVKTRPRDSSGTSSYNIIFFFYSIICPIFTTGWQIIQRLESCWSVLAHKRIGAMESLIPWPGLISSREGEGGNKSKWFENLPSSYFHLLNPITPSTETAGVVSEAVYSRWSGGSNMQFASFLCWRVTDIQQRRDWRLGEGNPCIGLFVWILLTLILSGPIQLHLGSPCPGAGVYLYNVSSTKSWPD